MKATDKCGAIHVNKLLLSNVVLRHVLLSVCLHGTHEILTIGHENIFSAHMELFPMPFSKNILLV